LIQADLSECAVCTADPGKVDDRTRSKWSRMLRYAAENKDLDEPLGDFVKRKGGINRCAVRYARGVGRRSLFGSLDGTNALCANILAEPPDDFVKE
jgi:hypothetical protein